MSGEGALQTFLLFPKLPTEIRLKVWHVILDAPRTISLKYEEVKEPENTEIASTGPERFVRKLGYFYIEKDDGPAVLLEVNSEAREEALGVYTERIDKLTTVGFSQWTRFTKQVVVDITRNERSIPVSFPNTTFSLSTRELPRLPLSLVGRVQNLRFDVLDPGYFAYFTMDILKTMTSLRTLTLAGKQAENYAWSGRGEWWQELVKDFEGEKLRDLEWECPFVSILDYNTGKKLVEIKAGRGDPEMLAVAEEDYHGWLNQLTG